MVAFYQGGEDEQARANGTLHGLPVVEALFAANLEADEETPPEALALEGKYRSIGSVLKFLKCLSMRLESAQSRRCPPPWSWHPVTRSRRFRRRS